MNRWIVLPFLWISHLAQALTATEQLEERLGDYQLFSAAFEQRVVDDQGRQISSVSGRLALQSRDRFRWETEAPFRQIIVADGEVLWVYDPDLEQVQVRPLDQALDTSVAFIIGASSEQLDATFTVDWLNEDGVDRYVLQPRSADEVMRTVEFRFVDNRLDRLVVIDALGQITELFLHDVVRGEVDSQLVEFLPPDGVDVIYAIENPAAR